MKRNGPTVQLEAIVPDNYAETLRLDVMPEQRPWVASIEKSLADAFVWGARARVARRGDLLVGFVLVFPYAIGGTPVANIARFMIDHRHQRQGLGRALMAVTLEWLASWQPKPERIRISTFPENAVARRLYRSCGFSETEIEGGEVVLWRPLEL